MSLGYMIFLLIAIRMSIHTFLIKIFKYDLINLFIFSLLVFLILLFFIRFLGFLSIIICFLSGFR